MDTGELFLGGREVRLGSGQFPKVCLPSTSKLKSGNVWKLTNPAVITYPWFVVQLGGVVIVVHVVNYSKYYP